jgi:hypothetical protein
MRSVIVNVVSLHYDSRVGITELEDIRRMICAES